MSGCMEEGVNQMKYYPFTHYSNLEFYELMLTILARPNYFYTSSGLSNLMFSFGFILLFSTVKYLNVSRVIVRNTVVMFFYSIRVLCTYNSYSVILFFGGSQVQAPYCLIVLSVTFTLFSMRSLSNFSISSSHMDG